MAHGNPVCVVTCEDFRLHRPGATSVSAELLRRIGGDYDLVTRAGASQDLVRGAPGAAESLLRDLEVSANLHGAATIFLLHHSDCGAYRGCQFADQQAEFDRHVADMCQAAERIRQRFPQVTVRLLFAALAEGSADCFELREVAPVCKP